ncbi:hypothetical protein SEA_DELIAN_39 [Gordonia phage Delian]|nr:hypothetical protein SEA_DELIAN_39 [Gordonia phage Delian]
MLVVQVQSGCRIMGLCDRVLIVSCCDRVASASAISVCS